MVKVYLKKFIISAISLLVVFVLFSNYMLLPLYASDDSIQYGYDSSTGHFYYGDIQSSATYSFNGTSSSSVVTNSSVAFNWHNTFFGNYYGDYTFNSNLKISVFYYTDIKSFVLYYAYGGSSIVESKNKFFYPTLNSSSLAFPSSIKWYGSSFVGSSNVYAQCYKPFDNFNGGVQRTYIDNGTLTYFNFVNSDVFQNGSPSYGYDYPCAFNMTYNSNNDTMSVSYGNLNNAILIWSNWDCNGFYTIPTPSYDDSIGLSPSTNYYVLSLNNSIYYLDFYSSDFSIENNTVLLKDKYFEINAVRVRYVWDSSSSTWVLYGYYSMPYSVSTGIYSYQYINSDIIGTSDPNISFLSSRDLLDSSSFINRIGFPSHNYSNYLRCIVGFPESSNSSLADIFAQDNIIYVYQVSYYTAVNGDLYHVLMYSTNPDGDGKSIVLKLWSDSDDRLHTYTGTLSLLYSTYSTYQTNLSFIDNVNILIKNFNLFIDYQIKSCDSFISTFKLFDKYFIQFNNMSVQSLNHLSAISSKLDQISSSGNIGSVGGSSVDLSGLDSTLSSINTKLGSILGFLIVDDIFDDIFNDDDDPIIDVDDVSMSGLYSFLTSTTSLVVSGRVLSDVFSSVDTSGMVEASSYISLFWNDLGSFQALVLIPVSFSIVHLIIRKEGVG